MRPNHADPPPAGLADRVELRQAPAARKADALPMLVRLLRRLVEACDRERARMLPLRPGAAAQTTAEQKAG